MNEIVIWIASFIVGGILGAVFFGGLWYTVKRGIHSKSPGLLFLGSMIARTGITLVGFYYMSGGDIVRLCLCLLGFIIARFIIMKVTQPSKEVLHEN